MGIVKIYATPVSIKGLIGQVFHLDNGILVSHEKDQKGLMHVPESLLFQTREAVPKISG
jgi:hypothetical protein